MHREGRGCCLAPAPPLHTEGLALRRGSGPGHLSSAGRGSGRGDTEGSRWELGPQERRAPGSRSAHTYFQGARPSLRKAGPSCVSPLEPLGCSGRRQRSQAGASICRVTPGEGVRPSTRSSPHGQLARPFVFRLVCSGVCLPHLTPVPRAGGGGVGLCRPQPHPHPTLHAPPRGFQWCCLPRPGQRVHGGPPYRLLLSSEAHLLKGWQPSLGRAVPWGPVGAPSRGQEWPEPDTSPARGSRLNTAPSVQRPGSHGLGAQAARQALLWPVSFLSDPCTLGCYVSVGSLNCHCLKSPFDMIHVDRTPSRCQALGCVQKV